LRGDVRDLILVERRRVTEIPANADSGSHTARA